MPRPLHENVARLLLEDASGKPRKLTQEQVAKRGGLLDQSYVSKYKTGEAFPDVGNLLKLAVGFGVSLDALVVGENSQYDALITRQRANEKNTFVSSPAEPRKDDHHDARWRDQRESRTVIDLRKALRAQITKLETAVAKASGAINYELAELRTAADKPGVLVEPAMARRKRS